MTATVHRGSRRRVLLMIGAGMTFVAGVAMVAVGLLWQQTSQAHLLEAHLHRILT